MLAIPLYRYGVLCVGCRRGGDCDLERLPLDSDTPTPWDVVSPARLPGHVVARQIVAIHAAAPQTPAIMPAGLKLHG